MKGRFLTSASEDCANRHCLFLQTNRFKHSVVSPVVGTRHQTGSTHQPRTHIADHIPIEVRHHHDIKLVGLGNKLKEQT